MDQGDSILGPYLPKHPLMAQAFVDCLVWSVGEPQIVEAFRRETGCMFVPGRTPLDRMIDDATGQGLAFVKQYVAWFVQEIWGKE